VTLEKASQRRPRIFNVPVVCGYATTNRPFPIRLASVDTDCIAVRLDTNRRGTNCKLPPTCKRDPCCAHSIHAARRPCMLQRRRPATFGTCPTQSTPSASSPDAVSAAAGLRRNVAATRQRTPCIDRSSYRFWHRRCSRGESKPGPARACPCAYPVRWWWRSHWCWHWRFSSLIRAQSTQTAGRLTPALLVRPEFRTASTREILNLISSNNRNSTPLQRTQRVSRVPHFSRSLRGGAHFQRCHRIA